MTVSRLRGRRPGLCSVLSLGRGRRLHVQESPNPGDRALSRGQDTPHVAERPGPTTSSACSGSRAALLDAFARKLCCTDGIWNLPEQHLSFLPSPSLLREPLLSLLEFCPRAWGQSTLGNWVGGTTLSRCGLRTPAGPLRATKPLGWSPPTITSQSPRGVQPPSLSPSSPEALSSSRRSHRQGDQFHWEVLPNTPSLPCL